MFVISTVCLEASDTELRIPAVFVLFFFLEAVLALQPELSHQPEDAEQRKRRGQATFVDFNTGISFQMMFSLESYRVTQWD